MIKTRKKNIAGQSVIEYVLLAVITIIALLAINFLPRMRNGAFSDHFRAARQSITGDFQDGDE